MPTLRSFLRPIFALATLVCLIWASPVTAEEKSIYSPIIFVDKEKGYIVVSNSGAVFGVEVPEAAKPHLDKLPVSGMLDIVMEMRPGNAPLLKSWKLAAGDSACRVFDGQKCK